MDFIKNNWQTLFSGIGTEVIFSIATLFFGLLLFLIRRRSKASSVNQVKMNNIKAGGNVSGRDTRN